MFGTLAIVGLVGTLFLVFKFFSVKSLKTWIVAGLLYAVYLLVLYLFFDKWWIFLLLALLVGGVGYLVKKRSEKS